MNYGKPEPEPPASEHEMRRVAATILPPLLRPEPGRGTGRGSRYRNGLCGYRHVKHALSRLARAGPRFEGVCRVLCQALAAIEKSDKIAKAK